MLQPPEGLGGGRPRLVFAPVELEQPVAEGGLGRYLVLSATKETLPGMEVEWDVALAKIGVNAHSITRIGQQLVEGNYDLGYVGFVLDCIQKQQLLEKVKRMAGAIYKELLEKYLLQEHQVLLKMQETKPPEVLVAKPTQVVAYKVSEIKEMYN